MQPSQPSRQQQPQALGSTAAAEVQLGCSRSGTEEQRRGGALLRHGPPFGE
jgi:hypothetical protein